MPATFTPIQVPLINGVMYSFAHCQVEIAGMKFRGGFKSIDYERTRKRDFPMSNSPDPVGKTIGENEYKASAEIYLAWWYAMIQTVVAELGPGYGDRPFLVTAAYSAEGFDEFQDVIQNCTIDSTKVAQAAGTGALTRTVDFGPTKILFNSLDDLANPLAKPAQAA